MVTASEEYWTDYDGLQRAKHELLKRYLGGWFPILARGWGKVLYIDCHAGRGYHDTGEAGSPILALDTLRKHRNFDSIARSTQVNFVFFERNEDNFHLLDSAVAGLGPLHPSIRVSIYQRDYAEALSSQIAQLRRTGKKLAPLFAFVDPFTFTLSMDLLNNILSFEASELFINFMYRYVDMSIHNPTQVKNMDELFGCNGWRPLAEIDDHRRRSTEIVSLFSRQLNAKFVTHMHMRAHNGVLKYVLLHATNHGKGRDLMKEAMWKVTPDGSFTAFERSNPHQQVLLMPQPDLRPLEDALWSKFAGKQVPIDDLYSWLLGQIYLKSHLHELLSDYRKRGIVIAHGYSGRFAFKNNPIFDFPDVRPKDA